MDINYAFISQQISHWLACMPNGYLGSDYGIDLKKYLHRPISRFDADTIIAKMRNDIPILKILPDNSINIYSLVNHDDEVEIYINVLDRVIKAA